LTVPCVQRCRTSIAPDHFEPRGIEQCSRANEIECLCRNI
jgi:hypothetical protein